MKGYILNSKDIIKRFVSDLHTSLFPCAGLGTVEAHTVYGRRSGADLDVDI